MKRTIHAFCAVAAILLVGCADRPITGPGEQSSAATTTLAQPAEGHSELNFLDAAHQLVTSLPLGQAVTVQAKIADGLGRPASGGWVTFQYCSRKGYPTDDVTRIDEAPLEMCDVAGEGRWRSLATVAVNATGIAEIRFCCTQFTPAIGFRFRYAGHGSGIMSHTVAAENFYWI